MRKLAEKARARLDPWARGRLAFEAQQNVINAMFWDGLVLQGQLVLAGRLDPEPGAVAALSALPWAPG